MKTRHLGRIAPAILLCASSVAFAAPPPSDVKTPPLPARAPDMRTASIALQTDAGDTIDGSALRVALTSALGGVPVTERGTEKAEELATVVVRKNAEGNVTIVFRRPDGREVERRLDLPPDRGLATETIALAAGNLVRDEASELVALLAPPPSASDALPPAKDTAEPPSPLPTNKQRISCRDGEEVFFGADFAPRAGTSSRFPDHRRTLSFNLLAGYSRGLNGFELGVGANIESAFMCGAQFAAGANVVGGHVSGLQVAPVNFALGPVHGAQIGVVGITKGDVIGAQVSVVALGGGELHGAQVAVVNAAGGSASGGQVGVANVAGGYVDGAQIGVANLAGSYVDGVQIGAANVAGGDVDGVQIGAANIAKGNVSGPQIGVVNYAETSDYPVGVVSIVRNGTTNVEGWATEAGVGMAGVRHGGRVIQNIFGVGVRAGSTTAWGFALGLGARVPIAPKMHLDFQVINYWLQKGDPFHDDAQIASAGVSFGYAISPLFGVFAAPTYNVLVTTDAELRKVKAPWGSTSLHEGTSVSVHAWPGATLGIRATL